MKIYKGASRLVLILFGNAIKIPNIRTYRSFLNGLLSNYNELQYYKAFKKDGRLCPIKFNFYKGLFLVMPEVKILNEKEFKELIRYSEWMIDKTYFIPFERKHDSFGWYKNQLVCVDYG